MNDSNANPVIVCDTVTLGYGSEIVLHEISLSIPQGNLVLFMGPNGAGKTTLLRAMLGLIKPRGGSIRTPFHTLPPGYVPQQKTIDPLYPVSVRGIVSMGLYQKIGWWGRVRGELLDRVDDALSRFNLLEHDTKTFSELSGGMRQKTLIARAFVSGADVFIMDEPTSELDEHTEHEVVDHLICLTREHGKTVLLVHHGLGRTAHCGDMICFVNKGSAELIEPDEATSMMALANAARNGTAKGGIRD